MCGACVSDGAAVPNSDKAGVVGAAAGAAVLPLGPATWPKAVALLSRDQGMGAGFASLTGWQAGTLAFSGQLWTSTLSASEADKDSSLPRRRPGAADSAACEVAAPLSA